METQKVDSKKQKERIDDLNIIFLHDYLVYSKEGQKTPGSNHEAIREYLAELSKLRNANKIDQAFELIEKTRMQAWNDEFGIAYKQICNPPENKYTSFANDLCTVIMDKAKAYGGVKESFLYDDWRGGQYPMFEKINFLDVAVNDYRRTWMSSKEKVLKEIGPYARGKMIELEREAQADERRQQESKKEKPIQPPPPQREQEKPTQRQTQQQEHQEETERDKEYLFQRELELDLMVAEQMLEQNPDDQDLVRYIKGITRLSYARYEIEHESGVGAPGMHIPFDERKKLCEEFKNSFKPGRVRMFCIDKNSDWKVNYVMRTIRENGIPEIELKNKERGYLYDEESRHPKGYHDGSERLTFTRYSGVSVSDLQKLEMLAIEYNEKNPMDYVNDNRSHDAVDLLNQYISLKMGTREFEFEAATLQKQKEKPVMGDY